MASWPPAAVTIREPEDKCDRQRGDSQRQCQADASMANAMAPDRQPASTANDSQEERALPTAAATRTTQTAGFAGSRYRSRWRSIKFTRPLRAHGSVSTCTQGRASDGLYSAGGFGGEAGEMTCDTAPHLAVCRAQLRSANGGPVPTQSPCGALATLARLAAGTRLKRQRRRRGSFGCDAGLWCQTSRVVTRGSGR